MAAIDPNNDRADTSTFGGADELDLAQTETPNTMPICNSSQHSG
jgi:hypothetical protein